MKKERVVIDQKMCRMVELILKGGAAPKEISEQLGISKTTVSRIKSAGFSAEQYEKDKTQRVIEEKTKVSAEEQPEREPEVPGQMQMQLPVDYMAAAKIEREISTEKPEQNDQAKMMRFVAAQVDKVIMKLDQIYNMQSMILRAVRKE